MNIPLPEEWKQKENLQWLMPQYNEGKVIFTKIPQNDDLLDSEIFTNNDRSIVCIKFQREEKETSEENRCYQMNEKFLIETDSSKRIHRLYFKFST